MESVEVRELMIAAICKLYDDKSLVTANDLLEHGALDGMSYTVYDRQHEPILEGDIVNGNLQINYDAASPEIKAVCDINRDQIYLDLLGISMGALHAQIQVNKCQVNANMWLCAKSQFVHTRTHAHTQGRLAAKAQLQVSDKRLSALQDAHGSLVAEHARLAAVNTEIQADNRRLHCVNADLRAERDGLPFHSLSSMRAAAVDENKVLMRDHEMLSNASSQSESMFTSAKQRDPDTLKYLQMVADNDAQQAENRRLEEELNVQRMNKSPSMSKLPNSTHPATPELMGEADSDFSFET